MAGIIDQNKKKLDAFTDRQIWKDSLKVIVILDSFGQIFFR